MDQTPIVRAVAAFDSQAAFAKAVGVHPSFVSQWVTGRRPVPIKLCMRIEEEVAKVGGDVTRFEFYPDIFGQPPASESAEKVA